MTADALSRVLGKIGAPGQSIRVPGSPSAETVEHFGPVKTGAELSGGSVGGSMTAGPTGTSGKFGNHHGPEANRRVGRRFAEDDNGSAARARPARRTWRPSSRIGGPRHRRRARVADESVRRVDKRTRGPDATTAYRQAVRPAGSSHLQPEG